MHYKYHTVKKKSAHFSVTVIGGVKQERPLKYETTRPVSAPKERSSSPKGAAKVKVSGTKVTVKDNMGKPPPVPAINSNHSLNDVINENLTAHTDSTLTLEDFNYDDYMNSQKEKTRAEKELEELIKVDIRKPESVLQYEGDLRELQEMEQNFRLTTLDLQKKLGLPADGLV